MTYNFTIQTIAYVLLLCLVDLLSPNMPTKPGQY